MRGALCVLVLLAGCATPEKQVLVRVPVEVRVPVIVACLLKANKPVPPAVTPNQDALAMTDRALVLLLAEERESLAGYAVKADAALTGCTAAQ